MCVTQFVFLSVNHQSHCPQSSYGTACHSISVTSYSVIINLTLPRTTSLFLSISLSLSPSLSPPLFLPRPYFPSLNLSLSLSLPPSPSLSLITNRKNNKHGNTGRHVSCRCIVDSSSVLRCLFLQEATGTINEKLTGDSRPPIKFNSRP